jgi:hypothetical protein
MQNIRRHGQSAYAYAVRSWINVPARKQGACSGIVTRRMHARGMYRTVRSSPDLSSRHTWSLGSDQGVQLAAGRSLGGDKGSACVGGRTP